MSNYNKILIIKTFFSNINLWQGDLGQYEILDNGTLVIYNSYFDSKKFECAVDYVTSPSR